MRGLQAARKSAFSGMYGASAGVLPAHRFVSVRSLARASASRLSGARIKQTKNGAHLHHSGNAASVIARSTDNAGTYSNLRALPASASVAGPHASVRRILIIINRGRTGGGIMGANLGSPPHMRRIWAQRSSVAGWRKTIVFVIIGPDRARKRPCGRPPAGRLSGDRRDLP